MGRGCVVAALLLACQDPGTSVVPSEAPHPLAPPGVAHTGPFSAPDGLPLVYPTRLAWSDDGVLYVSDIQQGAVFGYRDGVREVQLDGLDRPQGLAVHGDRLYVGLAGAGRVDAFDLSARVRLGSLGDGDGAFAMPNAIAVAPDGERIYVADSAVDEVAVHSADGTLIRRIGGPGDADGQLRFPVDLDVDGERLVVADQTHHRVQIFDLDGGFLSSFGEPLPGDALTVDAWQGRFTRLQSVAIEGSSIYVLDSWFGHVQVFDLDGRPQGFAGRRGNCATCVDLALDVEVGGEGALLVTDPERGRWATLPLELRRDP